MHVAQGAAAADEVEALASQRRLGAHASNRGMVLPFRPLSLAFSHVYYSVDLPPVCSALFSLSAR